LKGIIMTRWTTSVMATAVALTMGLSATLAQAQPDNRRGPPGHSQGHGNGHNKGHGHAGPDRHDRYDRHDRRPGPPPHAHGGRHGAGPQHNWVRGSRIPPQYRTRHYVVNDWRGHRLSPPPRGYHWVQNGGDYLLVAIATGVIAQLILSQ
jgi:Ni/Co efflux regulator RcnB